jgi:hypothetical protein
MHAFIVIGGAYPGLARKRAACFTAPAGVIAAGCGTARRDRIPLRIVGTSRLPRGKPPYLWSLLLTSATKAAIAVFILES